MYVCVAVFEVRFIKKEERRGTNPKAREKRERKKFHLKPHHSPLHREHTHARTHTHTHAHTIHVLSSSPSSFANVVLTQPLSLRLSRSASKRRARLRSCRLFLPPSRPPLLSFSPSFRRHLSQSAQLHRQRAQCRFPTHLFRGKERGK